MREHPDADEAWTKVGDARLALGRAAEARGVRARAGAPDAPTLAGLGVALDELGDGRAA